MRVRSQNMLASSEEAGRVSALLKEDISQMGAKTWAASSSSASAYIVASKVYQNSASGDFSSFALVSKTADKYDSLSFKKILYDNTGLCRAVEEIIWYVDGKVLKRKRCTIADENCPQSTTTCPSTDGIEMARDVEEFRFFPSMPGKSSNSNTSAMFPSSAGAYKLRARTGSGTFADISITDGKVTLGGFTQLPTSSNLHTSTEACLAHANGNGCASFAFKEGEEYSIYFEMPCPQADTKTGYHSMQNFQPGKDHLSIGLRSNNGTTLSQISNVPDFLFYPPQSKEACASSEKMQRHFNFSVPNDTNACIAITAAFYTEAYKGSLEFKNFKISRNTDKVYHFDPNFKSTTAFTNSQKADVKAFELIVGIKKKDEMNRVITVIPVPNNGLVPGG